MHKGCAMCVDAQCLEGCLCVWHIRDSICCLQASIMLICNRCHNMVVDVQAIMKEPIEKSDRGEGWTQLGSCSRQTNAVTALSRATKGTPCYCLPFVNVLSDIHLGTLPC